MTIDRRISLAAKLRAGVAAALGRRDPSTRLLTGLTNRPGDPRARFALYRATIKRTRQSDDLHAALKTTRPAFQPADAWTSRSTLQPASP